MDDVTETFFLCLSNMARAFEMYARLFRNKQAFSWIFHVGKYHGRGKALALF